MAITGISSIDNKQIIAAGALSAISANQALITSGGDSLQGLYDTVSTNSASWTGGGGSYPRDITADSILLSAELNPGDSDLAKVDILPTGISFVHPVHGYSDVNVTAIQNWDSTYETVSTNSASWTGGGGGSVPDEVMSAASAVSANSAAWEHDNLQIVTNNPYTAVAGWDLPNNLPATYLSQEKTWYIFNTVKNNNKVWFYNLDIDSGSNLFYYKVRTLDNNDKWSGTNNLFTGNNIRKTIIPSLFYLNDIATNSAKWNETTDTLSANSAGWGGNPLPISAGPGISLSMVDGVLVISTAGV